VNSSKGWLTQWETSLHLICSHYQLWKTGFQHLMQVAEPRFKVPSQTYFSTTVILAMYTCLQERTEKVLSSVQHCSITTDIWAAQHSNKSYIILKIHCIISVWELCSYCLSTKELPSDHTASSIATVVEEMLCDWNIDAAKVVAVVTDNAKNMVNTVNELDMFNFPCIGHTLQLGIKKALDVPKVHTALARVGRLVSHFHRSPKATYKLREKQKLLGRFSKIRSHMSMCYCSTMTFSIL